MIQTLFGTPEPTFLEKMKQAVTRTRENLSEKIDQVVALTKEIDRDTLDDLEAILISADLGASTTQQILSKLREKADRRQIKDVEDLKRQFDGSVCAICLETIQGEGGIRPTTLAYLKEARRICDERGWLLMLDEVQCGMGRTGKWFAHQWAGIRPDVMPLAKGLGSGVPIGAVVCGPRAAGVFGPGNHGTTFGGNPLAMRAGVETLRIMEEEGLLANAAEAEQILAILCPLIKEFLATSASP